MTHISNRGPAAIGAAKLAAGGVRRSAGDGRLTAREFVPRFRTFKDLGAILCPVGEGPAVTGAIDGTALIEIYTI